jgi:hypothetical protein
MVIRFSKATQFFCLCVLLLAGVLVSLSTRSITVSTPFSSRGEELPVLLYRKVGEPGSESFPLAQLRSDLAYFKERGHTPVSEQELLKAIRREAELPERPVLLLFEDERPLFQSLARPLLLREGVPWFPLAKSAALARELRMAGYAVVRMERRAEVPVEQYPLG